MRLDGKIAAITGGTAGIGLGMAAHFLNEGARVAIMGRNADKGEKALKELNAGDRAIFVAGDVLEQADVEGLIDRTNDQFGSLDILVNNAGGASDLEPLVNLPNEAFDNVMKWNVYSMFWATRHALKILMEKQSGRIINISSMEGKRGKPVFTAYTAAKHAVNGFTKSLAQEVGTIGITVNAICPGLVMTDAITDNAPASAERMGITFEELINYMTEESALKRPNTVDEVAALAVLLASDEGSGITGAILSVDGGTTQY